MSLLLFCFIVVEKSDKLYEKQKKFSGLVSSIRRVSKKKMSRKLPAQDQKAEKNQKSESQDKENKEKKSFSLKALSSKPSQTKAREEAREEEARRMETATKTDDLSSTFISLLVPILCDTCGFEIQSCADRYKRGLLDGKDSKEAMDECGVPMSGPFDQEDAAVSLPSLCCRRISTMISLLPDHNRLQDYRRFFDG